MIPSLLPFNSSFMAIKLEYVSHGCVGQFPYFEAICFSFVQIQSLSLELLPSLVAVCDQLAQSTLIHLTKTATKYQLELEANIQSFY